MSGTTSRCVARGSTSAIDDHYPRPGGYSPPFDRRDNPTISPIKAAPYEIDAFVGASSAFMNRPWLAARAGGVGWWRDHRCEQRPKTYLLACVGPLAGIGGRAELGVVALDHAVGAHRRRIAGGLRPCEHGLDIQPQRARRRPHDLGEAHGQVLRGGQHLDRVYSSSQTTKPSVKVPSCRCTE